MAKKLKPLLLATSLLLLPDGLAAQRTVTLPADSGHAAGALHRILFGAGYRDAWTVPITVPVLDLDTFAGGLTPFRAGGNQSRTLRFNAGNGRVYHFRSTKKFLPRNLPDDIQDTPAGKVIQDQSSAMHPTGHLLVSGLQEAAEILQPVPTLVYIPDDPRLGEFREAYAGMMGQIEERPEDFDDNEELNFAGAEKVHGAEKLLENLDESLEYYLDQRDWLRVRLLDFLVGDTDRGGDQWEFARYDVENGREEYRPIPKDRDYAFMHSEGLLIRLVALAYPKLVRYGDEFARLRGYVFMTREFDRAHLTQLTWADWEGVISELQRDLTDDVISAAVRRMPAEHVQITGAKLESGLRARRDNLRDYARKYYRIVNEDADVFAADEDERADIERHADGSVTVSLFREGDEENPAWQRRFVPAETHEIRVYMDRGNDRVLVRGQAEQSIKVRVVGGEGNDVLLDSSSVAQGGRLTTFYDARGNNTIVRGSGTRVSTKPYVTIQPIEPEPDEDEDPLVPRLVAEERRGRFQDLMNAGAGFIESKTSAENTRTWGDSRGLAPTVFLQEGSGVIIGAGTSMTDYGFRRVPYESNVTLQLLLSPTTGRLGAQLLADRHPENSRWSYSLLARAVQFASNRFFGFGNETPYSSELAARSLVIRDEVVVRPALGYSLGPGSFITAGPIFKRTDPKPEDDSLIEFWRPLGTDAMSQMGFGIESLVNSERYRIDVGASIYPAVQDVPDAFTEAHGMLATFIPIGGSQLALRIGGKKVWGDSFPLHEAAFIGGQSTLRGYRWNRFAGDAAAFGGAELRIPITRLVLFTRGDFGVLGLADAGRVWYQDESSDTWHTGFGGGLWFQTLSQAFSVSYAKGDEGRFYFKIGAPF